MKFSRGFTLIELLIGIVILAILSGIAISSYQSSIIKSRRADAHALLMQMMNRVQQYYIQNNNTYPATLNAAYSPGTVPTSTYYTFTSSNCGTDCFQITATAIAGTTQAKDTNPNCTVLSLDSMGNRTPTTSTCWNR